MLQNCPTESWGPWDIYLLTSIPYQFKVSVRKGMRVNTGHFSTLPHTGQVYSHGQNALWQGVVWERFTNNCQGTYRGRGCSYSILLVIVFYVSVSFTNRNRNSECTGHIASSINSGQLLATARLNPLSPPWWPRPCPDVLSRLLSVAYFFISGTSVIPLTSSA